MCIRDSVCYDAVLDLPTLGNYVFYISRSGTLVATPVDALDTVNVSDFGSVGCVSGGEFLNVICGRGIVEKSGD
ncbi:hypothetical protein ABFP36_23695, partial [Salmonella enterica subsp. enterica serovar Kentucky]|uniref:hypothetical protein n=1 Tax=Salmonella enterica TaxID=28901 RepID=UPI003F4CAAB1